MCKLTLDVERLSSEDNSLSADLKCSVYSIPQTLETVWFRGSRELATNRSDSIDSLFTEIAKSLQPLSSFTLKIPILNREQDFLQTDLAASTTSELNNYKCLVKNTLGYSEICELNASHRQQLILSITKRHDVGLSTTSLGANRQEAGTNSMMWPLANWPIFNNAAGDSEQVNTVLQQKQLTNLTKTLVVRYDLIALGAMCCILLIYFMVLILASFVHKIRATRRFKGQNLHCAVPNTAWHFSTMDRRTNLAKNNDINAETMHTSAGAIMNRQSNSNGSAGFQSSIIGFGGGASAANFYGGSNGDSEHDIIQSCSQSSQYEDLLAASSNSSSNNQAKLSANQQNFQSQALYFNHELATSAATMNANSINNNKNCLRYSSNYGCPSKSRAIATKTTPNAFGTATTTTTMTTRSELQPNTQLFRTGFSNKFQNNNRNKQLSKFNGTELILGSSRVPLIDGNQTSTRIKLDDGGHNNNYASQVSTTNEAHMQQIEQANGIMQEQEHIYDDVIYKKNIL